MLKKGVWHFFGFPALLFAFASCSSAPSKEYDVKMEELDSVCSNFTHALVLMSNGSSLHLQRCNEAYKQTGESKNRDDIIPVLNYVSSISPSDKNSPENGAHIDNQAFHYGISTFAGENSEYYLRFRLYHDDKTVNIIISFNSPLALEKHIRKCTYTIEEEEAKRIAQLSDLICGQSPSAYSSEAISQ